MRPFILLTGLLLSIYAHSVISLILDALIAPVFCMRINMVSIFSLTFVKQNEKWVRTKTKSPSSIQHNIIRDSKKAPRRDLSKEVILHKIVTRFLGIIIAAGICAGIFFLFKGDLRSMAGGLALGFGVGMVINAIKSVIIALYVHLVLMKRLAGCTDRTIQRMRNGEPFEDLNLKPVEEMGFKNVTNTEKILYYSLYMSYLAAIDNTEAMRVPSHEMMNVILEREFIQQYTLSYYWLLYFFSEVEPNRQFADVVFNKVNGVLMTDTGTNGKRVMAYYAFDIYNVFAGAERFVSEGYAAFSNWPNALATEKELEKKLLDKLSSRITQAKTAPQPYYHVSDNRIM